MVERELPEGFWAFYQPLHERFTPLQQQVIQNRKKALERALAGQLPDHLPPSEATESDWKVTVPAWAADQRNQMTGPADDGELVVKMINSGAPGVMLDLEDSMANEWSCLVRGYEHILKALTGELRYFDKKRDKAVSITGNPVIWNRLRGLHLTQLLPERTSASLFDLCMLAFRVDFAKLKHPLALYIPKSESAEEALLWRDMFQAVAVKLGQDKHAFKCMALVESHPLAYQMEEFVYGLRDHILGLNLGRWDYMASLIHFNLRDPQWVLPDRNTIPHDVAFFQNLRGLLPDICHKRGLLAIGGMTALFPDRQNPELNARALSVLEKDKKNEALSGMDGAWTGHPDQNEIAVAQFPKPNQGFARKPGQERRPNLRPAPIGVGQKTLEGTRAAVRTTIRYRHGVLSGKGASLLDGYMEDLATDRIYRLMIRQRIDHGMHTAAEITALYDEELQKLGATDPLFIEARNQSEQMIRDSKHDPE
jgi:malate synthase